MAGVIFGDDGDDDTVNSAVDDTVRSAVKQSEDTVKDTVDITVKTPMELIQMFDADARPVRSKAEGGHRTDVYLNKEEKEMLDFIKNREDVRGQAVLRVALVYLYRNVYRSQHRKT